MKVALKDISHSFTEEAVLFHNLTLDLLPNKTYALVGPSGSGKSTLLSIIAKWLEPVKGGIEYEEIEKVNWVFQNPHGVPNRTVLDHICLPLLTFGMRREQAEKEAEEYLDIFGLSSIKDSLFKELSGGEAQRLMLARGIASRPNLLLVDEPTAQLDTKTAMTVSDKLTNLANKGAIVVIATHDEHTRDACTDIIDLTHYGV
ncbi:MAG: ABC transporter ATP-binding protein [Bifidobacteriaceae bacterium]|jgi:putative ABC transport system ATP-binding protein|nr:ABC transporter ATP-binding protein [Bifidobacteriaceae bacterium]